MTKERQKKIMLCSKLKNKFNKERNHINWCNYKRQRNRCLSILHKTKKEYFNSLNIKQVSDNKLFWKSVKPFFSDKASNSSKIMLVEENNIISDEEEIANIMNNYFINVTKTLNLKKQLGVGRGGINEFENHISIKMIHEEYPEILPESLKFQLVPNNEVKKIENLDTKKSSTYGSVPATILKQCVNAYLPNLTNSINYSIQHSSFPQELKLSEVIPVYKKLNPLQKENYRPVSLSPKVSKVFQKIIHKQIWNYMTDKLAHSTTGFRKSHGTQNSLVVMLEQWKRTLDKGEYVSALFMDLSKAFDTINHGLFHDLLIAKLKACGFSKEALKLMKSYLKNRKQKVQINNKFSSEIDVIARVQCTLSNYADNNNLSISGEDKELIKSMLSSDFMIVEGWFFEYYMILNPEKCYFMCIGKNVNDSELLNLNNLNLKNPKEVEISGITLDRNLNFKRHIKKICRKAGQKLSALLRTSSHINTDKKTLLYKSIIKSQFAYCHLVWMFCFRQSNNLINKVHERALKLIYQDNCNFQVLLEKQHDFLIHQRTLQVLMTEIYKIVNGITPPIMNSLFTFCLNQHNLRNFQELFTEKRNTVNYALETVTYSAPVPWSKLPSEYKLAGSLTAFKSKIKSWKCDICTCKLCK